MLNTKFIVGSNNKEQIGTRLITRNVVRSKLHTDTFAYQEKKRSAFCLFAGHVELVCLYIYIYCRNTKITGIGIRKISGKGLYVLPYEYWINKVYQNELATSCFLFFFVA